MRRLGLLLALAALAASGCGDSSGLPGLGQPCTVLCSTGLTCSAMHFCVKSCLCDGGPLCAVTSLANGCPPEAECVVAEPSGAGMCFSLCGPAGPDGGCPPGQGNCVPAPDQTPICVGDNYPWLFADAGVRD
jgi:hypothetical protein